MLESAWLNCLLYARHKGVQRNKRSRRRNKSLKKSLEINFNEFCFGRLKVMLLSSTQATPWSLLVAQCRGLLMWCCLGLATLGSLGPPQSYSVLCSVSHKASSQSWGLSVAIHAPLVYLPIHIFMKFFMETLNLVDNQNFYILQKYDMWRIWNICLKFDK